MTRAGADIIVAHMGLTTSGTIGAQTTLTLDDCVVRIKEILDAAARINSGTIVHVVERAHGIHGFFGASSLERLPAS